MRSSAESETPEDRAVLRSTAPVERSTSGNRATNMTYSRAPEDQRSTAVPYESFSAPWAFASTSGAT